MKKKICGIYKITNKVNGKVYIGQSVDISKRWKDHVSNSYNENSKSYMLPFHCAIRKYGKDSFDFEILEEITDKKQLDDREIFYIEKYNSCIYSKKSNGYNCTTGGGGSNGLELPKEIRLKISKNRNYTYREENKRSKNVIFDGVEYGCVLTLCEKFDFEYKAIIRYLNHSNKMPVEFYVLGLRYADDKMCNYEVCTDKDITMKEIWLDGIKFKTASDCAIYCNVEPKILRSWLSGARKMPKEFYDRGLRYDYKDMSSYTHQEEFINSKTKKQMSIQSIQLYCDGMLFYSKKHFSDYYNIPYPTVASWFNKNNINKKYKELGLREITIDEANELIKNNKFKYADL